MKKTSRSLSLALIASTVFSSHALAQDPAPTPTPTATGSYGITIPPQHFPAVPVAPARGLNDRSVTPIPVPPPREIEQSAINIGPISLRESGSDRRRAGCRWTVRDESLQRRCRF